MKVRVEQIGELYYPQYRRMCVWKNYTRFDTHFGQGVYETVVFNTLEEATNYAKRQAAIIHEID